MNNDSPDDKLSSKKSKVSMESLSEGTEVCHAEAAAVPDRAATEPCEPCKLTDSSGESGTNTNGVSGKDHDPSALNALVTSPAKDEESKSKTSDQLLSTPPNKSAPEKSIMSPFGMLTPLQCLARIKSQVAKTSALHHSIGSSWFFALHSEFQKPYFSKVRTTYEAIRLMLLIISYFHQFFSTVK